MHRKELFQSILVAFLALVFLGAGCKKISTKPDDTTELSAPENFEYNSSKTISTVFIAKDPDGNPLPKLRCNVYLAAAFQDFTSEKPYATGFTDANGMMGTTVQVPAGTDSLYLEIEYIGMLNNAIASTNDVNIVFELGKGVQGQFYKRPRLSGKSNFILNRLFSGTSTSQNNPELKVLGTWDNRGIPDYLESVADSFDANFLQRLNYSLPERVSIPNTYPEFLAAGNETNIDISDTTDVWVTFLHEGAGYRNVFCYYSYETANPPISTANIDTMTVIFPNVSYQSGFGSGAKVYLGKFQPGQTIGWSIIVNGWGNSSIDFNNGILYSDPALNPGTTDYQQHLIFLYDSLTTKYIIGFEDIVRDPDITNRASDEDFNDVVFTVTLDPVPPPIPGVPNTIDPPTDCDNDGIPDFYDAYPCDENRAFLITTDWMTIAFDDEWPNLGNRDFNDLVVDAKYHITCDANNEITDIIGYFILKAMGTTKQNGFALQFPYPKSGVESVTGMQITDNYLSLSPKGFENVGHNLVAFIFDNGTDLMARPEPGIGINTEEGYQFITPDTLSVQILFKSPVQAWEIGSPPYNPFVIVNRNRGHEIHLNNHAPSEAVDVSLFGTGDDNSSVANGIYYRSSGNLSWAMDFPEVWDYPFEDTDVQNAYFNFSNWVTSGGTSNPDWFENVSGNRDESLIYRPYGISKK